MAMPDDWVNAIFTKLSLVYGARFKAQYQGVDVAQVRADWAHELDGVTADGVNYALHNLPVDFPPNVLQFRQLAGQAREPMRNLIPGPRAVMPTRVREQLGKLIERMRSSTQDPLAGARRLRDKERSGILLTRAQREFWRMALHREMQAEARERTENEDVQ